MAIEAKGTTTTTTLTVPQSRALSPGEQKFEGLKRFLAANMKAMASVLPKHMTAERLCRIALTTLQRNPKLQDCSPQSFGAAIIACSILGLEPDGLMGQAYLIPYGQTCTMVPGYKGLIKLARNSGQIVSIDAHEVAVGDHFKYRYGTDPMLEHVPADCPIVNGQLDPNWRPGAITHFYCAAKFKDGTSQFVVMPVWEVNEIRDNSQGYKNALEKAAKYNKDPDSPWISHYPEMGKKTAIRRASKFWPLSAELQKLVCADELADRGIATDASAFIDVPMVTGDEPTPTTESEQPTTEQPQTPEGVRRPINPSQASTK